MEFIFKNKYLLMTLVFFLAYIALNMTVSMMSITGIAVNSFGLFLLLMCIFNKNKIEFLFLFFISNLLLGPFQIVNLSGLNFDTFGRLDYLVANVLILFFIFQKYKNISFVVVMNGLLFLSVLYNIDGFSHNINFSKYYGYISKLSIGYLYYHFWVNVKTYSKINVQYFLLSLLILHLIVSLIQFSYPLYLRTHGFQDTVTMLSYTLIRPVGLLSTAYTYGITTVFVLLFYYHYKGYVTSAYLRNNNLIFIIVFLIIASISTRTVFLSIAVYLLFIFFIKLKKYGKFLMFILLSVIAAYVISNYYQVVLLQQSNGTKLLLWYLTIDDFLSNSSILEILFGHGIGSSALLAEKLPQFVSEWTFPVSYDNRIDNIGKSGFPIHNIFIEMLYENGAIIFMFINYYIILSMKYVISCKDTNTYVFFLFLVLINYSLHNGIYNSFLFFIIFLLLDKGNKSR
jgi:hypothetical protein